MKSIITAWLLVGALGICSPAFAVTDAADKDFDYGAVELRVGVWLDRDADEIYQAGERMNVGFQVNEDAYAVVYRMDVDGNVTILWPRSRLDDGFVFSGHKYQVPVPGAAPLITGRNEGEGFVEMMASRYPFDLRELQIDFHSENLDNPFNYAVAGDPFLAINDINYAITGLEDTADYVVSDFVQYYVHRKVDHPRYLCSQCHVGDEEQYDPYDDECTLDIEYDYGWSNRWYDTYGYYPVYAQPVYVYIDPWNYRPWVNFWYWPSYRCGPTLGYSWYSNYWAWNDSPYYYGDIYVYNNGGGRRYRPLTPGVGRGVARKTQEYTRVTPMVKGDGPNARQRAAMTSRTPGPDARTRSRMTDTGQRSTVVARSGFRGQAPVIRSGPVVTSKPSQRSQAGLRIREPGSPASRTATRSRQDYRHVAGSGADKPALRPVAVPRGPTRTVVQPRSPDRPSSVRRADKPATVRGPTDRTIKQVEPRRRGTRIWNSGSTSSRNHERTERVTPRSDNRRVAPKQTPRISPRKRDSGATDHSQKRGNTGVRNSDKGRSEASGHRNSSSGGSSRSSSGKSSSRNSSGGRRRAP